MMSKFFKCVLCSILTLSLFAPFCFVNVKASNLGSFDSYLNEPDTSEGNGYVALVVKNNSNGILSMQVYQFTTTSSTNYEAVNNGSFVDVTITNNKLTLYFSANEGSSTRGTVYRWLTSSVQVSNITTGTGGDSMTFSQSFSSYTIVGFIANGSIGHLYNNSDSNNIFSINWNVVNDGVSSTDIEALVDYVNSIDGSLDGMTIKLTDIQNYLNSINTNIQTSNNLLTNIFNKLGEILSSITGSGNSNVQDEISNSNQELDSTVQDYNDIEVQFNDNLNNNLNNIDTNNHIFNSNDFLNTATFLSSQINRIVTSNAVFQLFITTTLILGLAFFIIGKKV